VKIVTGDTKVVEKGKCDGIYINTCGIGFIPDGVNLSTHNGETGDIVVVTGPMGNHETALMLARKILNFKTTIKSDANPLNRKVTELLKKTDGIKTIKDPTRGGLASALTEITENSHCEITLREEDIPVDREVRAVCDLAGLDPLYLANEGKFVLICKHDALEAIKEIFPGATAIGTISGESIEGRLLVETISGGLRKVAMLETTQLPRIC
jgi:hydrogenase expression/formation protein HypE